jgi:hypothetical protein
MNYTKGEWKERLVMGEREIYVDSNDDNIIHEVICRNVRHWNAPLIKAAPDMYEALKLMQEYMVSSYPREQSIALREHASALTQRALAKAESS